jgi:LysR family nod box-dependent transcriptional activator
VELRQIDLNLLVALDALLKERSVTRAGTHLGIGQPAASGALARLRELLRDPLLERAGRGSRLTPFAAQLAGPLQTILSDMERILDRRSTFNPGTSERVFRIAGSDYATISVFKPLVAYVSSVAPRVQLCFQRAGDDIGHTLAACDLDIAVQPSGSHAELATQHLFADRFVCAVWKGNTEVADSLTEAQFRRLRHVSYSHPSYGLNLLDYSAGPIARDIWSQAVTESLFELPWLLRGTNLIALVQERLGVQLQANADIRLVECPVKLSPVKMSMWWHALYNRDEGHTWLRAAMMDVANQGFPQKTGKSVR